MQQLQYDSFYKFLVSVGIALVAAPIALLLFLISGKEDLLISQEEMASLCAESAEIIQLKLQYLSIIYKYAPLICMALILTGCCLIYRGCKKWKVIQTKQDERLTLEVDQLDLKVRQMSQIEVDKKYADEVGEVEIDKIRLQLNDKTVEKGKKYVDQMMKYKEIENKCFRMVSKEKGDFYFIEHNMRIGKESIDIVASSNKRIDLIYEVKYWADVPSLALISTTVDRLIKKKNLYEISTGKKAQSILMVITSKDNKGIIEYMLNDYCDQVNFIVEDEESL